MLKIIEKIILLWDLNPKHWNNYPDNCQTLDLTINNKIKEEEVQEIVLHFHPPTKGRYNLYRSSGEDIILQQKP